MGEWYYCVNSGQVSQDAGCCKAEDRLGPYATRAEAENALVHLRERNEQLDAAERAEREANGDDPDERSFF